MVFYIYKNYSRQIFEACLEIFKLDPDFLALLLPLITYHFILYNNEAKLQWFVLDLNRIFEFGHIMHKKTMIHAINTIEQWNESEKGVNSVKIAEKKKFLANFEFLKKSLDPKSLINAYERYLYFD